MKPIRISQIVVGDILRSHSNIEIAEIATSIRKNDLQRPITVTQEDDGKYTLIDGYARLRACQMLGMERIKCEVLDLPSLDNYLRRTVEIGPPKLYDAWRDWTDAQGNETYRECLVAGDTFEKCASAIMKITDIVDVEQEREYECLDGFGTCCVEPA